MKIVSAQCNVVEDCVVDLPVSGYRHGGIEVIWTPLVKVRGRVTIQVDADSNGVWESIAECSLESTRKLSKRFLTPLPARCRCKLDLLEGKLERFSVFIAGKEKKDD